MSDLIYKTLGIPEDVDPTILFGPEDSFLKLLQESFNVQINPRDARIRLTGDETEIELVVTVLSDMFKMSKGGKPLNSSQVKQTIELVKQGELAPDTLRRDVILTYRGRSIRPKTPAQKQYVDAIRNNTITFCTGPAGTGKTYLAMAMAVSALERKEVGRIILSRPIVEAGENLGFLPGTLTEKVDPYIRPLYDALFDMMDAEYANRLLDQGTIEIAPLAFMRGRTLNDSFIILDEAQNTTKEQMKMFLTRLGFASKMVITGDRSQTDLSEGSFGLSQAMDVCEEIDGIATIGFTGKDVVRNSIVAEIVAAYDRADGGANGNRNQ